MFAVKKKRKKNFIYKINSRLKNTYFYTHRDCFNNVICDYVFFARHLDSSPLS